MTQNARRIDTLDCVKTLEAAGIERKQAEAMTVVFANNTELQLQANIKETEFRLTKEIAKTNLEIEKVRVDIRETELRLTKEIGKTRVEIEQVRADIKDTEARLTGEIEKTKKEVVLLRCDLELKIEQVKSELELKIEQVKSELELKIEQVRAEIEHSKNWIVTWVVSTNIALAALIIAAIKLL